MQPEKPVPRRDSSVVSMQLTAEAGARDLSAWVRYIQMLHYRTMDLTLDRVKTVIDRITGNEIPFRVISVAGTNGKGSVATMLESIFRQAGYSTGLYTSPHLVDFNERFVVEGKTISDSDLLEVFELVESARGDVPLTFFEYGTAIAVKHFMRKNVEVAIFEVGLGGRKDAVNILDADIACITSIGTDHVKWLGNTREQIGFEKAGILRSHQLAICTDSNLPESVRQVARELSLNIHVNGEEFKATHQSDRWSLSLNSNDQHTEINDIPYSSIPGSCQKENAAGAVAATLLARQYFDIPDHAIRRGISMSRLEGRLQLIQEDPQVLLDVAHNIESVRELRNHLVSQPVAGKNIALMSALSEKPIELMIECIKATIDEWHLCGIHDERGVTARQLFRRVQPVLGDEIEVKLHYDAKQAFDSVLSTANSCDRVVVFGSFLTVGEVMQQFRESVTRLT